MQQLTQIDMKRITYIEAIMRTLTLKIALAILLLLLVIIPNSLAISKENVEDNIHEMQSLQQATDRP